MALTERQLLLYIHTCDIYNPEPVLQNKMGIGDIQDLNYPADATYEAQSFFLETAPEIEKGKYPIGRINKEDTVSLLHRAHFDVILDIRPNAMIKMLTPGTTN